MFHLHCDYILPALLNIIFVSSNRIQCLNSVLWSYNEVKKIMCRWFSCTNRWLLHVCVKWTYMCMLWKFTPCFHGIIWLKWGHFFIILKVHSVTKTLSKHTNIQVCLATGWWCYLFIHLSFAFINYIFIVSFCLSGYFKPLDRVQIKSP